MYVIVEESIEATECLPARRAFGIAWQGEERIVLSDVGTCRAEVEALVQQLNAQHLDPAHLLDVVYDFLSS